MKIRLFSLTSFSLICLSAITTSSSLFAEEGMWTYNNLPTAKLKQAYGFEPTKDWLEKVRLSSVRLAQGCSGSFVSGSGLVMTNHHCAASCIQELSTKEKDYFAEGFTAAALSDEKRCPELEINQLVEITTVTKRVTDAVAGKTGQEYTKALNGIRATIEKECSKGDENTRCEVVSLYNGGVYDLYQYRRYQDVRLVFAPEFRIAFFGGDPDNFQFPRYDLDLSFVRVYDNGKPLNTPHHFAWSKNGSKEGDLTFVAGNPGSTERLKTVAELEEVRDHDLPNRLFGLYELRGMLWEFQQRGEEQKRVSTEDLFGVENSIKALKGRWDALQNDSFFQSKVAAEKDIRVKVSKNPEWNKLYGKVWQDIEQAVARRRQIETFSLPVSRVISRSQLLQVGFLLNRAAQELPKPNAERLPGYSDAGLPALKQRLFTEAPIYKELEIEKLAHGLEKLRESLGPDSEIVKKLIGKQSPRELATKLIEQTNLDKPELRKKLFEGGASALKGSADPMVDFAAKVEAIEREFTLQSQKEVQPVLTRAGEALAKLRFTLYGTTVYPDATFTPRLSYGSVKGWMENGRKIGPYTIIGGAFERQTGADPFRLPDSWMEAKGRLDLTTPFNFVTTNDIIGGNSGSPVFNRNAEIVGLIFDGNIHSLGGAFGFDETYNRSVAVDSRAMTEALGKIYKAERVLEELQNGR